MHRLLLRYLCPRIMGVSLQDITVSGLALDLLKRFHVIHVKSNVIQSLLQVLVLLLRFVSEVPRPSTQLADPI